MARTGSFMRSRCLSIPTFGSLSRAEFLRRLSCPIGQYGINRTWLDNKFALSYVYFLVLRRTTMKIGAVSIIGEGELADKLKELLGKTNFKVLITDLKGEYTKQVIEADLVLEATPE